MKKTSFIILTSFLLITKCISSMEEKSLDKKTEESKQLTKSNIERLYEASGQKGTPSLLFISQLNYAKKSIDEINKLNIPEELKESIIGLKNKFSELLIDLLRAVKLSEQDKNDILLLINAGANINYQTNAGSTALISAALKGHKDIVELLITKQPNLELKNNAYGMTALMEAINNRHTDIAKILIENGADVNTTSKYGDTPLISAAYHGAIEIVQMLIKRGVNIDHQNKRGMTALMEAIALKNIKIIQLLLEARANVKIETYDQPPMTALTIARNTGNQEIINLLEKAQND